MSSPDSRNKYAYTTIMDTHENNARQAPEVITQEDYPEAVVQQQHHQHFQQQYQQYPQQQQYQQYQQHPLKPEDAQYSQAGAPYSAYSGSQLDPTSPRPQNAALGGPSQAPSEGGKKKKGTICGCTTLVFVLCVIIALLSAAVIGLAAGTGVEASRANTADERVAELSSSLAAATATATATGDAASATSTSFAQLDRNCSADPNAVSGTTYDAFSLLGNWSFTIQCNRDATGGPLMSLFSSDFDSCMDHCASYNQYLPDLFGSNNPNTTCGAISFIPLWTPKAEALKGGAPGNCYLKPTQTGDLDTPNIGTECHAAVLNT